MSKGRAIELISLGDKLFTDKAMLDSLCQEIADNVYPERADFVRVRVLGEDWAAHLMDSYPVLARRELGNSMSAIRRPRDQQWFATTTLNDAMDNDPGNARFLEYLTKTLRARMYNPRTDFIGATKGGDHDFVTFGNAIISVEEAASRDHLFYRLHHLRDCAWLENEINAVDHLHRKDEMSARQMIRKFGESKVHKAVRQAAEKEPHRKFKLRVVTMPSDEYDYMGEDAKAMGKGRAKKLPFVNVYVDVDNVHVMREGGLHDFIYVVSRWHRISGFAYAFSPAAMTGLPDARTAQALASIIMEAGEKAVNPPLMAREEAVREANIQAGAISWIDQEYDERLGEAIKPFHVDPNMSVSFEMRKDLRDLLAKSWFLDKLQLPEAGAKMTAYEISRRLEEHVRNLLPLFEPMEVEYDCRLLDKTFNCLLNMNAFDWSLMPDALKGTDIAWSFKNPLQEASSRSLISQGQEVMQIIQAAQQFGMNVAPVKVDVMVKDMVRGTSAPATWRKTPEEEEAEAQQMAMRAKIASVAQELSAGADVASKLGQGAQALQQAGLMKGPQNPQGGAQQQEQPLPEPEDAASFFEAKTAPEPAYGAAA